MKENLLCEQLGNYCFLLPTWFTFLLFWVKSQTLKRLSINLGNNIINYYQQGKKQALEPSMLIISVIPNYKNKNDSNFHHKPSETIGSFLLFIWGAFLSPKNN